MTIYDKPTKALMREFAEEMLQPGQIFAKADPVQWFKRHYPEIKSNTVEMHAEGMSVNSNARKHHRNVKAGSGHDLFFKLGPGKYRLWEEKTDPAPVYAPDLETTSGQRQASVADSNAEDVDVPESNAPSTGFAFEHHLRDYLARNLNSLGEQLTLYQDEDMSGVEFPVGGRFIDILAVDAAENFVVIELKVSRGYDRAIGQLLRYMGWVDQNLAGGKDVRGIIVANEITEDLILAASRLEKVTLAEYELFFKVKPAT